MKQDELILENACRTLARQSGWVACKLEKNGHKGIPDDLFISPDERILLIEFKKDEKQKPRQEQVHWMERFPHIIHLVGSIEQFKSLLAL